MRLLVPLDGSPLAEFALGPAAQLLRASPTPGTLVLVRVVEAAPGSAAFVLAYDQAITTAVEVATDYLRDVAQRNSLQGLTVEFHAVLAADSIGAIIVHEAAKRQCDDIVMSSHGRSGLARMALGSVAAQVARLSTVPVFIVRAGGDLFAGRPSASPFTLLVPLDGSPFAERAIAPALALARELHGAIRLLMVVPPAVAGDIQPPDMTTADEAAAYLRAAQSRFATSDVAVTTQVAIGEAAHVIAALSQKPDAVCDLIVMATHGRTGVPRLVLGSVTDAVLSHTQKPMLVVPAVLAKTTA